MAEVARIQRTELEHPAPDGLVGHGEAAPGEEVVHVAVA